MYNLRQGFHNGDCAHTVHTSGVTDPAIFAQAQDMDNKALAKYGRPTDLMARWPTPMDMCCPVHAQRWSATSSSHQITPFPTPHRSTYVG